MLKAVYVYLIPFRIRIKITIRIQSKLEFELPYRVVNAELLAVVVEDTTYYI